MTISVTDNQVCNADKKICGVVAYNGYTFWCDVNITFDYIFFFLKDRFPEQLIIPEFNNIDIFVFGERLPVEIQSTIYHYSEKIPRMSDFEQSVEKQIRENINTYGRCWFFFDSEFYRYLRNHTKKDSSVQLDWLYEYIKLDQLKVFVINHRGEIRELFRKDFDFIRDISVTCKMGKDDDFRVLTKNKDIIYENVLKSNGFTTDYIYNVRNIWKATPKQERMGGFKIWCRKQKDDRIRLLGYMMLHINNLNFINDVFNGNIIMNRGQSSATIIGIFESEGSRIGNKIRFVDKPNVAQRFPAYTKHKDKWDKCKDKWFTAKQLEGIVEGKIDYFWYEKLETVARELGNQGQTDDNSSKPSSQDRTDKDKEVNIEIKNKDQIITINIKKNEMAGW